MITRFLASARHRPVRAGALLLAFCAVATAAPENPPPGRPSTSPARPPVPEHGLHEDVRAAVAVVPASGSAPGTLSAGILKAVRQTGLRVVLFPRVEGVDLSAPRVGGDETLWIHGAEAGKEVLWYPEFEADGAPVASSGARFVASAAKPGSAPGTADATAGVFHPARTHLLLQEITETAVRTALDRGQFYVAYDDLGDPTGFSFGAVNTLGVFPMGETAVMAGKTRLVALTPLPAKLRLFLNGARVSEAFGTNLTFEAKAPGAYRVEAWLSVGSEERPWIYSNPVRVRTPGLADLKMPSMDLAPGVELRKDLTYTEGPEDQAAKHQLDLYVPKDRSPAPIFFFIHGGAWKYGDRAQYPPLGSRYATEGFLTVVPSYRLAPKHPFPAQIEDVAAAFAWTVKHAAGHGGDTNRLYVAGHSAGGHLAALLALDRRPLARHGLSPDVIRGVLALSGVYDLTVLEAESEVFGRDLRERREASPLHHLRAGAPPFLITYCQWDYFSLPAQAKQMHAALRLARLPSELVYVPGRNHISEMLTVTEAEDPTVAAALKFMR